MNIFPGFLRKAPAPKPINLDNLRVASPCPTEWSKMVGDDRVRHCSECNLNVYNLSAMTEQQVQQLLTANRGQRLCGRFYRRADGTVLTQDCPWSLRVVARKVSRIGTAVLTALLSANFAVAKSKPKLKPAHVEIQEIQQNGSGMQIVAVDPAGAVIPSAHITIENKIRKIKINAAANSSGEINLARLPAGEYSITVQANAFKSFKHSVRVHEGKLLSMTVSLEIDADMVNVGVVAVDPNDALRPSPTAPNNPDLRRPSLRF